MVDVVASTTGGRETSHTHCPAFISRGRKIFSVQSRIYSSSKFRLHFHQMAPRRKRSSLRKNQRNQEGLSLEVRRSAPVLRPEQKDACVVPAENSRREETAECSSNSRFCVRRSRRKGALNLETIPKEMLLHIMSFFTPLELVRTVGPTCRRTMVLSRYPELWRRLQLDGSLDRSPVPETFGEGQQPPPSSPPSDEPNAASRLVATAGTHLRCLEISERRDAASLIEQVAAAGGAKPPKLRTLSLRRIPGPFPARILLRTLRKFPGIRRLVLRDVRRLRSMVFFRQLGSNLPNLSCLDVGHCPQFGTAALAAVATSGLALSELSAFRDRGYRSTMPHATDEDFSLFCARMKDTITVIKINAVSLTDESCKMLIKCTHLTTLHLRDARGFSAHGILRIVTHLPKLKSLDLSGAFRLTSVEWADIFVNMVAAPWIEVLKLAGCFGIDDFSAEHMKFPALLHLSLGGCFLLGEAGSCAIITTCRKLRHLDLEGIGPGFIRCLHLLPVYTPKLEILVFPLNNCSLVLLAKLLLKMKHLKLFDRYEHKRVRYWRAVAIDDELRRLNGNQAPE